MGISRIEEDLYKKKLANEDLVSGMSEAVGTLLEQAFLKIKKGEMKIEDVNDIARLWAVMEKSTDYLDVIENRDKATTGALPELSTKEAKALGVTQEEGVDGELVSGDLDIDAISKEAADELFSDLNEALNDKNVESMDLD